MAELVEELDNEMIDVEQKTKHEEKLKYEREKKETMERWDAEMDELKSQLKTFQRVNVSIFIAYLRSGTYVLIYT